MQSPQPPAVRTSPRAPASARPSRWPWPYRPTTTSPSPEPTPYGHSPCCARSVTSP